MLVQIDRALLFVTGRALGILQRLALQSFKHGTPPSHWVPRPERHTYTVGHCHELGTARFWSSRYHNVLQFGTPATTVQRHGFIELEMIP